MDDSTSDRRGLPGRRECAPGNRCCRWDCDRCGRLKQGDWLRAYTENLTAAPSLSGLFTLTPPGADQLPWDETRCAIPGPHEHSGPRGCRVNEDDARTWLYTRTARLARLRAAAYKAADRATRRLGYTGPPPRVATAAWGMQARGVSDCHFTVLLDGSAAHTFWLRRYIDYLDRNASDAGFGYVDRNPLRARAQSAFDLARYSARNAGGYLAENAGRVHLDGLRVGYITPKLTRATGCTITRLRRARHLFAHRRDPVNVPAPVWLDDPTEADRVAMLLLNPYRPASPRPPPLTQAAR